MRGVRELADAPHPANHGTAVQILREHALIADTGADIRLHVGAHADEVVQHVDHAAELLLVAARILPRDAAVDAVDGIVAEVGLDFRPQTVAEAPADAADEGRPKMQLRVAVGSREGGSPDRRATDMLVLHQIHASTKADIQTGHRLGARRHRQRQHRGRQQCTPKRHRNFSSLSVVAAARACGPRPFAEKTLALWKRENEREPKHLGALWRKEHSLWAQPPQAEAIATGRSNCHRRKRAGVEPARDRSAAPTGFEVRPTHRGRFSSTAHYAWVSQAPEAARRSRPLHPVQDSGNRARAAPASPGQSPDAAASAALLPANPMQYLRW